MFRAEAELLLGVGRKPTQKSQKSTSSSLPKSLSLLSISKMLSDEKKDDGEKDSKQKLVRSVSMYDGEHGETTNTHLGLSPIILDERRLSTSAPPSNPGIPSPNSSSPNSYVTSPYSSPGSSLSGSPSSIDTTPHNSFKQRKSELYKSRSLVPEMVTKEYENKKEMKETYDAFLDKLIACPVVNTQIQQFVKSFEENFPHPDNQSEVIQNFVENIKKIMVKAGPWSKQITEQTSQNLVDYITRILYNTLFYSCIEDIKRDEKLSIKIRMLEFVEPKHLEVASTVEDLQTSIFELKKINYYCTVEDKMKCIVQCCKEVIAAIGKKSEEGIVSADAMIPTLTILILKAQVPYLVTNLNYVIRFSTSHKYSENFYYLTQVLSVVYFVESLDASSLTIDPNEFERGMSAAKLSLQNSKLILEKPLLKLTKKEEQLRNAEAAKDIAKLIDSHWYY